MAKSSGWCHSAALTLIFSAKESLFKALYPKCQKFFGFAAAEVQKFEGDKQQGRIQMVLTETICADYQMGDKLDVDYRTLDNRVITGLFIPATLYPQPLFPNKRHATTIKAQLCLG